MRYLDLKSQLVRPFLKARFLKEDFQAQPRLLKFFVQEKITIVTFVIINFIQPSKV